MSRKSKRKRRPRRAVQPVSAAPASRKHEAAAPAAMPKRARRSSSIDERPPAPWGSFPLTEIAVLVGIVMLVLGFVTGGERRGLFLGTGLALASLGGLELSIREHFAGYRSHSALLAGFCAFCVLALLFYLGGSSPALRVAIAAAVFALAFVLLGQAFRRRAGVRVKVR